MADNNGYLFTLDNESSDNDENYDSAFQRSDSFTVQMCPTYVQRMRAMAQSKIGSTKRKPQSKRAPVSSAVVKQSSSGSGGGVGKWFTSLMTRSQSVTELRATVSAQRVRYIFGSTPAVKWRKRSLNELQQPLLDAYSSYVLGRCSSAPAEVRVLAEGVRVRYYASPEAGKPFEFLGDFGDLAHYAALRCVVEQSPRTVAFVPFATGLLETTPELVASTCVQGAAKMVAEELMTVQNHPPLFVCLMRSSMEKALRCHMFVCSSAEQAVAIASEVRNVMVSTMTRKKRSNDEGCGGSGTGVRRWETFLRSLIGGTARKKDKSRGCPFIADKPKNGVPRSRSFVHVNRINRDMLSGCDVLLECNTRPVSATCDSGADAKDGDQRRVTKEAEIQFTIEELKGSNERENNDWQEEWGRSSFLP